MAFHLCWNDDPDSLEPAGFRFISNRAWYRILDEIEAQGIGDLSDPFPPRPRFCQRLLRGSPSPEFSPDLDVDPESCSYPIKLFQISFHGTSVVSARTCRAILQRLSREPTLEFDESWPKLWRWFYDYLGGAVEHEGFEVG